MYLAILHNRDHHLLEHDPGREAREDVVQVAEALAAALIEEGFLAEPLGIAGDSFDFLHALQRRRPGLVVNLCESLGGDSRGEMAVPSLLELLRIPYTGSPALALGLALHKDLTKDLLRGRGVPTPAHRVIERLAQLEPPGLPFPLIVKPLREDGSVGIDFDSVVQDRRALEGAVRRVHADFGQPALVEQYIEGREIYVALLGNHPRRALPLTEIAFGRAYQGRPHVVSYRAKWDPASAECRDSEAIRCSLEPALEERVSACAIAAFDALGCSDYGRVDLRLSPSGEPFVLEVNPNCDLHPEAGFAKAAAAAGMDYRALARHLVELALQRTHGNPPDKSPGPPAPRHPATARGDLLPTGGRLRAGADR